MTGVPVEPPPALDPAAARLFGPRPTAARPVAPPGPGGSAAASDFLIPAVPDAALLEVYDRVADPTDPFALRDLFLARVEDRLGARSTRPALAEHWRASRVRRTTTPDDVLRSRATVRFVKELFNSYFRDDLYGDLRTDDVLVLSSGSVDEQLWGLPTTAKDAITYALDRDWYGYSDSRGREQAREAVAAYESARLDGPGYTAANVAVTMGGTFAMSGVADFVMTGRSARAPALCAVPNYPPLVESVARRGDVELVPTPTSGGVTSLAGLLERLTPETPLVLLQTATNPTGTLVDEQELAALVAAASPATTIVLDECHEWLGPPKLDEAYS